MDPYAIRKVEIWPLDIPITDPFVVATGARLIAQNLFVRVTLASGAQGYGEIAPFPEVGGEDRASCHRIAVQLAQTMLGMPAIQYKALAGRFQETALSHPAVRCGLETATVDALCREMQIPLWGFLGGADVRPRETDITIPIASLEKTVELSRGWYGKGFRLLKMKVGVDADEDIRRLEAVHRALPDVTFIADANQGFSEDACRAFVKGVARWGGTIVLLEQPVRKDQIDSLAALRRDTGIPVAADESARSLQDTREIFRRKAADFINIKIMKSGLVEALEMAAYARSVGLRLMIGGMVEARVAMGCSFGMVLGTGGYEMLDLDTPLLLRDDPVKGGYRYEGARLQPWNGPGLDMAMELPADATAIS